MNKRLLLLAIVAIAAGVRFWGLGFGLPHTNARPDENFVILVARSFLAGHFSPAFYDYPWLYMWVLTALYLVFYAWGVAMGWFHAFGDLLASWPVHWAPFFLISRGLSATLGTATVPVVYWIGRRIWNDSVGLIAAFFLALAFLHVRDSHFGTTDVAVTFLIVLTVAWLIDAYLTRPTSLVAVGVSAGLAAATKYSAVLLAAPILTFQALEVWRRPDRSWSTAIDRRFAGLSIACLLAFLVGVPFVFLAPQAFWQAMKVLAQTTQAGQGAVPVTSGWLVHLRVSLWYGIGVTLLVAGLVGMLGIAIESPAVAAVLFAFPLAYYAVAGSARDLFFRYAIPLVPFLCLSGAWAVWRVSGKATDRSSSVLTAVLAAAVIAPSAVSVYNFDHIISQTDNRVVVARWFDEHVPDGSSVLQSGSLYGHAQFTTERHYREWIWDRQGLFFKLGRRPATGQPDWILLQESPLPSETQSIVKDLLAQDYVRVQDFVALSLDGPPRVYDPQDAFFMPLAGFDGVRRPGPNFYLYRHAGAVTR